MRTIALAALFAAAVPATAQYAQQAPSPTVWTPTMDQWLQMDLSTRVLTLQDAYVHPPESVRPTRRPRREAGTGLCSGVRGQGVLRMPEQGITSGRQLHRLRERRHALEERAGYEKLDQSVKTVVDDLLKAREVCVAQRQAHK